eukprot:TRINITY_DN8493_c0_g1_i1.p1 TRINITY_DN8493_c0_g1~~TRINITY_DN8493_c0_g1_i1.p1  ORF type:complete len:698 (-),score=108.87 TRINITY_DN8493_c0_g1_i1:17-2110(-)
MDLSRTQTSQPTSPSTTSITSSELPIPAPIIEQQSLQQESKQHSPTHSPHTQQSQPHSRPTTPHQEDHLSIPNILHMLQQSKPYQPVLPPLGQSLTAGMDPLQSGMGGGSNLLPFANLTTSSTMNLYSQPPMFPFHPQSLPLMPPLNLLNPSHDTSASSSATSTPTSSTSPTSFSSTISALTLHGEGLNQTASTQTATTPSTTSTSTATSTFMNPNTPTSNLSIFGFSPRVSQQGAPNSSESYPQNHLQFLQQLQMQQLQLHQLNSNNSSNGNVAESAINNTSPIVPIAISKTKSTSLNTSATTITNSEQHINVPSASTAFLPTVVTTSTPTTNTTTISPNTSSALAIESMSTSSTSSSSTRLITSHDSLDLSAEKILSLKKREEVARAAYKVWLKIKPGHKEQKDRWWALYYRRVHPRFHLRDNYLGRKINAWIDEDMAAQRNNPEFKHLFAQQSATLKPGRKPKLLTNEDGTPVKKRKPNSSKDGQVPAYLNVELVHPDQHDPNDPNVKMLLASSIDGVIDWNLDDLEVDVDWFKQHRQAIMDSIPSLAGPRIKNYPLLSASPTLKKHKGDALDDVSIESQPSWFKMDVYKSSEAFLFKADLPGLGPTELAGLVQTDGNRLAIKGERKPETPPDIPDGCVPLIVERHFGPFDVQITLPTYADISRTEQVYWNGVLTVKVPLKNHEWKSLDIQYLN